MNVGQGRPSLADPDRTSRADIGGRGHAARQRKGKTHKPSKKESKKERADLLRSLRLQECLQDRSRSLVLGGADMRGEGVTGRPHTREYPERDFLDGDKQLTATGSKRRDKNDSGASNMEDGGTENDLVQ
ncbi:hypothetical protein NDU88_006995 [Pleurodeles waltl]|uniref:Uncharacterized protein n=1 Tax=Pleurodeles waltl TaxID=8319 RepID=A0AAV7N0V7_PLEWA|nr:hypothetical protein NDU88_006995 [Pleurodeles waltl]